MLVSKNSGGEATYAKIVAARHLGLPVVMMRRPKPAGTPALHDPAQALAWALRHRRAP
jgi:precorrin-6A/cobalt-precorrin-6A reductase